MPRPGAPPGGRKLAPARLAKGADASGLPARRRATSIRNRWSQTPAKPGVTGNVGQAVAPGLAIEQRSRRRRRSTTTPARVRLNRRSRVAEHRGRSASQLLVARRVVARRRSRGGGGRATRSRTSSGAAAKSIGVEPWRRAKCVDGDGSGDETVDGSVDRVGGAGEARGGSGERRGVDPRRRQGREQPPDADAEEARVGVHRIVVPASPAAAVVAARRARGTSRNGRKSDEAVEVDLAAHGGEAEDAGAALEAHQEGLGLVVAVMGE